MAINFATGGTQQYPGNMVLHTKHSLNGNSTVQWSSIPAGVRRIMVSFQNVSHNSNANRMVLRIGDNTSGYMPSYYTGSWMHENLSGGAGGFGISNLASVKVGTDHYFIMTSYSC